MKVYITHEKDGYGGRQVEEVFLNKATAQDHIIASRFGGNAYYTGKEKSVLEGLALIYIECYEVNEG